MTLNNAIREMLHELVSKYGEFVAQAGLFPDLVAARRVRHRSSLNGSESEVVLEMAVRAMNPEFDPRFQSMRFLALRAHSPTTQGFISTTLLHASTQELRERLEGLLTDSQELLEAATQLIEGLPEESDPDLWR
ncbi:MAG: hypothetical protein ACPL7D_03370 [Candidatus Sumerlaeaceae bacterium]